MSVAPIAGASLQGPLDTEIEVETPEHIVFRYRVAGPARRAVAHVLDLVICYGALALFGALLWIGFGDGSLSTGQISEAARGAIGVFLVALFATQWLYFFLWEAKYGRSPGKMLLGLVVVTTTGRAVGWRRAAIRNLLRVADLLPTVYAVGLVSMSLTSRFQRLGDVIADTMVIARRERGWAAPIALSPPAEPMELASLPETVTLDAEERAAIELFLRRREKLGVAREMELAEMIANRLGARVGATHANPSRLLALLYDRALHAGRDEAPRSSFRPDANGRRA